MRSRQPAVGSNPVVVLALPVAGMAFWNALIEHLRAGGVDVRVCSELTHDQYRASGSFRRIAGRLRVWLWFPFRLLWKARGLSHDRTLVILAPTSPPYLPCLAALALRSRRCRCRCRVVHLVYDLYPDVMELGPPRWWHFGPRWVLGAATRLALARSDSSVFLGPRLAKAAQERYGVARRPAIIPVGGDGRCFADIRPNRGPFVTALYSGNLGHGHDEETIAAAIAAGLPPRVRIDFHASGVGYRALRRSAGSAKAADGVRFGDPLPHAAWVDRMAGSELSLITLKPGAGRVMIPSKVYSAMLAGQAIIAICERDSDLADTVLDADAGWVVEPGDVSGLLAALSAAEVDRTLLAARRTNAQRYARHHFDMRVISGSWRKLLEEIAGDRVPAIRDGRADG